MMLRAEGLYGHIQINTWKSFGLLIAFAALIAAYWWAACVAYLALAGIFTLGPAQVTAAGTFEAILADAWTLALERWWVPLLITGVWFAIASFAYAMIIRAATGARPLSRRDAPQLYNTVERLAIAAGLPMPRVEIIETSALNAYAAGLFADEATVAVTRGLLNTLTPRELEAVLAHEITHIKNGDVRLMVVALVFAGGLTLVGDLIARVFTSSRGNSWSAGDFDTGSWSDGEHRAGGMSASGTPAMAGILAALVVAAATFAFSYVAALLTRFAISRSREFMADAGAVELTKDADALMSALAKISRRDHVPGACESVSALMISSNFDDEDVVATLFSTHPSIEDRLAALAYHAGGRLTPSDGRAGGAAANGGPPPRTAFGAR